MLRKLLFVTYFCVTMITASAAGLPASGQEITAPAFSATEKAAAEAILLNGPDEAITGSTVTCTLQNTPPVDLKLPLVDQLDWLIGPDRMYAYVVMPGQSMVPLDVEGTIVFGINGATLRPQITFGAGEAGEYRVLIDWNQGQNQLVEKIIIVRRSDDNDNDDDDNDEEDEDNPLPFPAEDCQAVIIWEQDEAMQGVEGMELSNLIEAIRDSLQSKEISTFLWDKDQEIAKPWLNLINQKHKVPALVVTVPSQQNKLVGIVEVGDKTIDQIDKLLK